MTIDTIRSRWVGTEMATITLAQRAWRIVAETCTSLKRYEQSLLFMAKSPTTSEIFRAVVLLVIGFCCADSKTGWFSMQRMYRWQACTVDAFNWSIFYTQLVWYMVMEVLTKEELSCWCFDTVKHYLVHVLLTSISSKIDLLSFLGRCKTRNNGITE